MKKLFLGILVLSLILVGITGCASKTSGITPPRVTSTLLHSYGLDSSGGKNFSESSSPNFAAPSTTYATTTTAAPITQRPPDVQSGLPAERMIIRTANMALVVEDVNAALQKINNLATANGGYVINSNIQEDQNRLYASIYFRVDADKFNDTLQALRLLAVDVRNESTSGQDVTEEYVDLDAQLRNLQASESQLLDLMNKAGSVEEILKVQQQLTSTRGQIEQLQGRMQYLKESAALSSISVSLEQSKLALEFSASATTVKQGDTIQFNPVVSGGFQPYSFEWNFGDSKTSTESNPQHSYQKPGAYTVKLTVKDDKANTIDATREAYITVLDNGWKAGNVAGSAWNGLVAFGRFLLSFIIWIGILSPIWIVILVVLYFTIWRKRKKKS